MFYVVRIYKGDRKSRDYETNLIHDIVSIKEIGNLFKLIAQLEESGKYYDVSQSNILYDRN